MAIDTQIKRMVAMSSSEPWLPNILPDPDGSVEDIDRWMLLGMYRYDNSILGNAWDYLTESTPTIKVETSSSGISVYTENETIDLKVI